MLPAERLCIVGDMEERDAVGNGLLLSIGVRDKRAAAYQHDRLGVGEFRPHPGKVGPHHACPAGMLGWERRARCELRAEHRKTAALGEGDEPLACARGEIVAEQHEYPARVEAGEAFPEFPRIRRGAEAWRGRRRRRRPRHLLVEHVHRQRQKHWPSGGRPRNREGAPNRLPQVFAAPDFAGPFDDGRGETHEIAGQPGFAHQMPGILLARGDDERRLAGLGGDQHAHRVAEAAHRVQIDEADLAAGQRPTVGHADRRRLLQPKYVGEVGSVDERIHQRHFGRTGIAENVCNAFVAQDVDEDVAGERHGGAPDIDLEGRRERTPAQ